MSSASTSNSDFTYQTRTTERLELPKVLSRLESLCACELGRARARKLSPSNQNEIARAALNLTSQAKIFVQKSRFPPFGGLSDVSESLKVASIGATLESKTLLSVGRAIEGARRLRETLFSVSDEIADNFDDLFDIAERIVPRKDLEKAITEAIDDNGEIKDDASLDLLRARRNIRSTQTQIQTRLRGMLSDNRITPHLQDAFVTVRDGRYCLPVKAESRGSVPGIVHDRSSSGNAFFIEPQAVVDLNNRLRELAGEERQAIDDILRTISGLVGGAFEDLRPSIEAAGDLDFIFAKAQFSLELDGLEPLLRDEVHGCFLKAARHPLVRNCVANDIKIGAESAATERGDFDVLMLTGPNTGGKTIVLKTLGLLCLMTACGLHIPVENESWIALPGQIHVDIGDEQSIEQNLSTFSGHLKNIVGILRDVKANDLVLFDEIGAGTDPDEGAALAKAVLRSLSRKGAHVLATTHYGELKQFALSAGRFENASVEFDPKTLSPTYRLRIGVPGASNALDIAARLDMPPDIVARARKYLGRERVDAEAATQQLEATQRQLSEQTDAASRERESLEKLRRDYEARIQRVEQEREREIERARRDAKQIVETATQEANAALRELRSASQGTRSENKGTEAARGRLRTLKEKVDAFGANSTKNEAKAVEAESETPIPQKMRESAAPRVVDSFKVGQIVKLKTLDREGEIIKIENNRAEVRIGAMKIEVKFADLEIVERDKVRGVAAIQARKAWMVPPEINLIGMDTVSGIEEVEKYLDDALLAGMKEVRIVHGRGSGALRTAVHRFLKSNRAVNEFELAPQNEGGEGATTVKLG
ncbi:DNA mismatch repair protein MutS2 [Abditibacterium utsteinense]|uniref:Endonuclease MutS2 n=1 Tax=Abditibacterium utsteinense TaxID=1960156 RepID=A0A2S8SV57_9BACT|nr:endonuclease MutS2 [Abditibacterium utsteinense]PQV64687.1 DNA mismatch repair protein MutS2 [Abditibacterium utsteinense]